MCLALNFAYSAILLNWCMHIHVGKISVSMLIETTDTIESVLWFHHIPWLFIDKSVVSVISESHTIKRNKLNATCVSMCTCTHADTCYTTSPSRLISLHDQTSSYCLENSAYSRQQFCPNNAKWKAYMQWGMQKQRWLLIHMYILFWSPVENWD